MQTKHATAEWSSELLDTVLTDVCWLEGQLTPGAAPAALLGDVFITENYFLLVGYCETPLAVSHPIGTSSLVGGAVAGLPGFIVGQALDAKYVYVDQLKLGTAQAHADSQRAKDFGLPLSARLDPRGKGVLVVHRSDVTGIRGRNDGTLTIQVEGRALSFWKLGLEHWEGLLNDWRDHKGLWRIAKPPRCTVPTQPGSLFLALTFGPSYSESLGIWESCQPTAEALKNGWDCYRTYSPGWQGALDKALDKLDSPFSRAFALTRRHGKVARAKHQSNTELASNVVLGLGAVAGLAGMGVGSLPDDLRGVLIWAALILLVIGVANSVHANRL